MEYLEEINGELSIKQDSLAKLRELKKEQDRIKKELETLSKSIVNEIKEHKKYEGTQVSGFNYVVKGGYFTYELDEEKLKKEHLMTYEMCLKPKFVDYSTSLVSATREKKEK